MTEKARKIFDILGVDPDEEFKVHDNDFRYSFNHNLGLEFYDGSEWHDVENVKMYRQIFNGYSHIIKIPKPTEEDKIVIAYAKVCGCKYIAKDKCGVIWGYGQKPYKKNDKWIINENDDIRCFLQLFYPISFLSWEDEEPYYIGE